MNTTLSSPTSTATSPKLDDAVAQFLSLALPPAEAALLRLCFGLDGPPCSLATAARRLGLRPAAALRLERRAMRALRRAALALGEDSPTD
jgi:hypothetical protein